MLEKHGVDIGLCPVCKIGSMETVATYYKGVLCKGTRAKPMKPIIYNADRGSPLINE